LASTIVFRSILVFPLMMGISTVAPKMI